MTNFTPEMIEMANAAKTADELLALEKDNNIEMTEENAKAYFEQLNPVSGELSDDELDNVAGGGCGDDDEKEEGLCKLLNKKCAKCGSEYAYERGPKDRPHYICSKCGTLIWDPFLSYGG